MVRVEHFVAVPCAETQKAIKELHHEQLIKEGKRSPGCRRPSTIKGLVPTDHALTRCQSSVNCGPEARAEHWIEQNVPKEVSWFRGSLASGQLTFSLPHGDLYITIPERKVILEHYLVQKDGNLAAHCKTEARFDLDPAKLALNVLLLVDIYITSTYGSAKARLMRFLKDSVTPSRAIELHHALRINPRDICVQAGVAKFGWYFLKAESILNTTLELRFANRIEGLREELKQLSMSDLANCIPDGARSKSRSRMIDYLLQPQYTFHGPKNENIPNIASFGLLSAGDINPATGTRIPGRLGSTYGPGVYVTEEAHLALTYAEWNSRSLLSVDHSDRPLGSMRKRVIICASVLGRAALVTPADGFRGKESLFPGAHSHVANGGQEFVLPKSQVLPLYTADFDWAPVGPEQREKYIDYARQMVDPPKDSVEKSGRWWKK